MKVFGIISSLALWVVAIWALLHPEKSSFHWLVIAVAAATLFAHIAEASFFLWHPKMKPHLSARNLILTLFFGAWHFMPIFKGNTD